MLKIIGRFLRAGLMEDGACVSREEGTPQGGPLSPLLANLLLDDLDKELEKRGHRFCRYADDCNIYVQSQAAGERVLASVTTFLEQKLRLRVNRDKSAVAYITERKFLGHRLLPGGKLGIAPQSLDRAKERLGRITARSRGVSFEQVIREINEFVVGWVTLRRLRAGCSSAMRRARRIWRQWTNGFVAACAACASNSANAPGPLPASCNGLACRKTAPGSGHQAAKAGGVALTRLPSTKG